MRDAGDTSVEKLPRYLTLGPALARFAVTAKTQSQEHIKPVHRYIALRLAVEGGFFPDEITPHPPLACEKRGKRYFLEFRPELETSGDRTVFGGLKTKDIDVVVTKPDVGPAVAVSVKGTGNAFRNLTNRMEEAIGDCTNLHIMYPGLVYAFFALLKAVREAQPGVNRQDICVQADGEVAPYIARYHDILAGLAGRRLVRDELTRYEAVCLLLVECFGPTAGNVFEGFPRSDSPIAADGLFQTIYEVYDLRYPYMTGKRDLLPRVLRAGWDEASPAFLAIREEMGPDIDAALGYSPRIA